MRMSDPKPQFTHFVNEIATKYPEFAYLHVTRNQADGGYGEDEKLKEEKGKFLTKVRNCR